MVWIESALDEHAFKRLFIKGLGWDRLRSSVTIRVGHRAIELAGIAQKSGFAVFLCQTERAVMANRDFLRRLQHQLRLTHREHLLIYACENPRKQFWQWTTTNSEGRQVLHREHLFSSQNPPMRLLRRVQKMNLRLNEADQTARTDVLSRVRAALSPEFKLNLRGSFRAAAAVQENGELAMAMKRGEPGAFGRFVEFYMPLARYTAKTLIRRFEMEPDDAEQTAMIGLMYAARRYDPDRGVRFSNYASYLMSQVCYRYGLEWGLRVRVPDHLFWRCSRVLRQREKLMCIYDRVELEEQMDRELTKAGMARDQWQAFLSAREMAIFCEVKREQVAQKSITSSESVIGHMATNELTAELALGIESLPQRQADIVRMHYGIRGNQYTLEQIATKMGITRERVRQIEVKAKQKLLFYFKARGLGVESGGLAGVRLR